MTTKGVDRVFYSVSNMKKALSFYRDMVGMKVLAETDLDKSEITNLFKLTASTKARAAFLKSELQDSVVELIEFTPNSGKQIRNGPADLDWGIYDIAWLVKDIKHCADLGNASNYKLVAPIVQYQPNWVPWQVKETVLLGPDDAAFVLFERMTDEAKQYNRQFIRWNHSAYIVQSVAEGKKFLCDVLNLDLKGEMELPLGIVDSVLGIPKGTPCRGAFVEKKGTNTCIIELLEMKIPGKPLAPVAKPPNLGIFGYAFEVDNLDRTLNVSEKAGYPIISGPVELNTPLCGKNRAAFVSAPYGTWVQLFQR
jgi:catechol 2,3-dioxygenase-like lactoylglutathione lyase family enzyme